jgi:predicted transcriptional regulator
LVDFNIDNSFTDLDSMTQSTDGTSLRASQQRYTFQPCAHAYSRLFWGYAMASPVLSFSAEEQLVEKLDELVSATGRDREYHLLRALECYLGAESDYLREIDEGIADAKAGRLVDLEIVKAEWVARANNSAD